jgi:hypothetical protein
VWNGVFVASVGSKCLCFVVSCRGEMNDQAVWELIANIWVSPIMSIAEIFPKMVIVKMGMFPRIPQPECESFALHRHEWQGKHGDMTQYEIARGGKKLGE